MRSLLAICPKLPQSSDIALFSRCLSFLKPEFDLTFVDSLEVFENLSYEQYTDYWKLKIAREIDAYDAFIGFSLGGILLQNSLETFNNKNKTVILCSPPSKLEPILEDKLNNILKTLLSGKSQEGVQLLHQYVFEEAPQDYNKIRQEPWPLIASRLQFGLGYVLNHVFDETILKSNTRVYQLVGERSKLVTKDNILLTPGSILQIVPKAGNRVLEDNPLFSQAIIKEWLHVK